MCCAFECPTLAAHIKDLVVELRLVTGGTVYVVLSSIIQLHFQSCPQILAHGTFQFKRELLKGHPYFYNENSWSRSEP